ncbi:MAG: aldo/keto reductase [Anaerolineae bacterium]|nr:aldo/keto reductase [Anaerolineae bacterium]
MEKRKLGNSDMEITPVGFGAWAIGGSGWEFAWGAQDDANSINAIHKALDLGINWIDTAAAYGLGHSEEIVAQALQGRANRPYVFTKCSLRWDENGELVRNLKAESVRKEVEDSLRRLQTDVIDLYQIHWPNPDEQIEEGWAEMAKLKQEGKLRWIGVSNFSVSQMQRAMAIAPITSLQPPYSLVKPEVGEEILPFCQQQGIGVIVYSPMQSGLLTGKMSKERVANMPEDDWRKSDEEFTQPRLSRNLALADLLGEIGARHDVSAAVVSIAWTLHNPVVTAAIVGGRSARQVEGTIAAMDFRLSDAEVQEIESWLAANP